VHIAILVHGTQRNFILRGPKSITSVMSARVYASRVEHYAKTGRLISICPGRDVYGTCVSLGLESMDQTSALVQPFITKIPML
jgi:hypothetical protein